MFNSNRNPQHGRPFTQTSTLQVGPVWGQSTHTVNHRGVHSPQTFSAGANVGPMAVSGTRGPGFSSVNAAATIPIVNTPTHQLNATASHNQNFNAAGRRSGETNTGGVQFSHVSGATAFATVSHTPGYGNVKTVGGSVPLADGVNLSASRSMAPNQKPNDSIALGIHKSF